LNDLSPFEEPWDHETGEASLIEIVKSLSERAIAVDDLKVSCVNLSSYPLDLLLASLSLLCLFE